tara:strand:+ start:1537 stop:2049 length:513 start_codon:yes stop_codon:yes gene_type:complete
MDNTEFFILHILVVLGIIIDYYSSPKRVINWIKLHELTHQETEDICHFIIEQLSQEYRVINPEFEITNYEESEINSVKYNNGLTLAFFCGVNNKISLQIETFKEEGCSFSSMVGCIAHEFQHYLDSLSFETPEQWSLAYEKNVNYYEYKANSFASKKLKKLSKLLKERLL